MESIAAATPIAHEVANCLMTDSVYQSHEARYADGDLKLLVSAFSDAPEKGRWCAILMDLSEPPSQIQRDQRAAMGFEDLLPMAQEMLDGFVRCQRKTPKLLEWHKSS